MDFLTDKMKLLLVCLFPAILAAPYDSKRFIVGPIQVDSLFDLDSLKCDVQIILDVVGSDPTELACEAECHKLVADGNILNYGCPLICHAVQNLAHYFHETPKPGDQNQPCGGLTSSGLKRFIVGPIQVDSLFDLDSLKCDVQIILDVVGSDPTEQACEAECHKLVTDGNILNYGCPLICHAVQNLAHYFHETPKPGDQNQPCGGLTVAGTK